MRSGVNWKINKRIRCPLFWLLIQVSILYTAFFVYFPDSKKYYYNSLNDAIIKNNVDKIVNECGEGYFVSWLVLQVDKSKDKYFFKDFVGCDANHTPNCSYSVKISSVDSFYNKKNNDVDHLTYSYLKSLDNGDVDFPDRQTISRLPSMKHAVNKSKLGINLLGLTVIKDARNNIVYVFTLTNTTQNNICSKSRITEMLYGLSIVVRRVI